MLWHAMRLWSFLWPNSIPLWFQCVLLTPAFGLEWALVLSLLLGCCVAMNSHGQVLARAPVFSSGCCPQDVMVGSHGNPVFNLGGSSQVLYRF